MHSKDFLIQESIRRLEETKKESNAETKRKLQDLQDHFAALAMQAAIIAYPKISAEFTAECAYRHADAMLLERSKHNAIR